MGEIDTNRDRFLKASDKFRNSVNTLTVTIPSKMSEAVKDVEEALQEYDEALRDFFLHIDAKK